MRKLLILVLIAAGSVILAACSGGGSDNIDQQVMVATTTPVPTRAAQVEVAPSLQSSPTAEAAANTEDDGVPVGGVFTRNWSDPPTLDPHLVTDTTSAGIVVEIFSGLVSLNEDLDIVPELAESWSISGGGTVYEFKLRPDLKFSNGEPVTAEDVKWSIERAAHPDTESPVAEIYLGDIVGVNEIIEGRGDVVSAPGVTLVDDRTIRIEIDAPKAYFLAKLTYPTAYILNRDNVEAGGDIVDRQRGRHRAVFPRGISNRAANGAGTQRELLGQACLP